jgi:hypothetical protein
MRQAMAQVRSFFLSTVDLWVALGLALGGVYFLGGHFTTVRFDRERIHVQVERGWIQVCGLYHYTNQSRLPAALTLRVPFPVDENHPAPQAFFLREVAEDGRSVGEITPTGRAGNVSFRLLFWPGEAKWVRLDYTQRTRNFTGRYLLTTTRAWRRPIGRAEFRLRLPSDFELVSSSYEVATAAGEGSWRTYSFSKTDFYPDRDWEFAWAERRGSSAGVERRLP